MAVIRWLCPQRSLNQSSPARRVFVGCRRYRLSQPRSSQGTGERDSVGGVIPLRPPGGLGRAGIIQFLRGCPHRCTYCGQHDFWVRSGREHLLSAICVDPVSRKEFRRFCPAVPFGGAVFESRTPSVIASARRCPRLAPPSAAVSRGTSVRRRTVCRPPSNVQCGRRRRQ